MLPGATVPRSLADLLAVFRPCFTAPTFPTFVGLLVGLIAQTRRRTVCGMLTGAGLDQVWHHSRAHRLFTNARWSSDALGLVLADLIVTRLLPADSALTIAVDDTLFKRSGKKVFGVAWHHDGAAKGPKPIGFGNCWVVAGIVVQLSFLSRPVCLPVLARLWRPRHTGKIAHARVLAELIVRRHKVTYSEEPTPGPRLDWADRVPLAARIQRLPAALRGHCLVTPASVVGMDASGATPSNLWLLLLGVIALRAARRQQLHSCCGRCPLGTDLCLLVRLFWVAPSGPATQRQARGPKPPRSRRSATDSHRPPPSTMKRTRPERIW